MPRILVPAVDLHVLAPLFSRYDWTAVADAPADAQLLRWQDYPHRALPDAPAVVVGAPYAALEGRAALFHDASVREILDALEGALVGLTATERRIALRLADGEPIPDIAETLRTTPEEVRRIARRVYRHFGVTRHADFLVEHRRRSSRPVAPE